MNCGEPGRDFGLDALANVCEICGLAGIDTTRTKAAIWLHLPRCSFLPQRHLSVPRRAARVTAPWWTPTRKRRWRDRAGVSNPVAPASFTAAGNRYRIEGNRLTFDGGTQSMDYFIGSNAAGRSFLSGREGYLFEVPVTWYARKQIWDASPGFEKNAGIQLTRAIEPTCLLCHASRVRPVLGSQNRYGDPPFLDNGVACERCHGPGSEHVKDPGRAKMVDPARLEPDRRDSICGQCHLTGEARVERAGHRFAEFQAGERLADYATYLVWDTDRPDMKVTSHVEKLAASACKRASGDRLWCGTCHDPHTNSDKTQAACMGCHPAAHRAQERCAGCHMPKSPVADDGGHGVMTDHSIPARTRTADRAPPARNLKAFLEKQTIARWDWPTRKQEMFGRGNTCSGPTRPTPRWTFAWLSSNGTRAARLRCMRPHFG